MAQLEWPAARWPPPSPAGASLVGSREGELVLIVVEDGGGLANRLFVFANVIATALATGHRVLNPAFRNWADSFEGTAGDHLGAFPRRSNPVLGRRTAARLAASISFRVTRLLSRAPRLGPVRTISLEWPDRCDLDDPEMVADLKRRRLVLLKGWLLRNPSGVAIHTALLREFFRPVDTVRQEADGAVGEARARGEVLVGVHVRHRDYRSFMGGAFFYPFTVYLDLMRSVAAMLAPRRASFLVCSDEPQEAGEGQGMTLSFSRLGAVHDLWALSRCDLIMGPPSTFSAWAAFLGGVRRWELRSPDARPSEDSFVVPKPVAEEPGQG